VSGSYTVTPRKAGFTFTPQSQAVTVKNGNVAGVRFSSAPLTYSLSGNLTKTGANANVALGGTKTATTKADAAGNYSFAGLAKGLYTVTPKKVGVTFSQASHAVTINGANVTSNFTGSVSIVGIATDVQISGDGSAAVPCGFPGRKIARRCYG
jgi:hypothetical protein